MKTVILVVDDEEGLLLLIRAYLESVGYDILTAANGAEGLGVFDAKRNEISAVLSDGNMPVVDGIQMSRGIRETSADVPIIMMSGCLDKAFRDEALRSGVDVFLEKPISLETIKNEIARLVNGNGEKR